MSETSVSAVYRAQGWRTLAGLRLPDAPLANLVAECASIAGLAAMFLAIAVWNGFPITFYDTGAYILQGMADYFVPERSPVYSYFLRFGGAGQSLWWVAALQTTIVAFVMVEFARAEAPKTSLWRMLAIGAFLTVFTGIAWVSAEIEPDCFTAIVVLATWLLAFRAPALGSIRVGLLVGADALAIGAHPSHVGLAAGLVLMSGVAAIAARALSGRLSLPRPGVVLPATGLVLAIAMVLAANYALTKQVFFSRSGPVFMAARMIEDGVARRVLDETCPNSGYVLCRYKDRLPATADEYLWEADSPFNRLGRFRGSAKESQALMIEGFKRHPFREAWAMVWNGARQFFMFRTGDGIAPQERVLATEFQNFLPAQMQAYATARQQREEFSFVLLNIVHATVSALALLMLLAMIRHAVQIRDWTAIALPVFVLLALVGNALVCGATSGPHDRYQGRLIWIAVFVVIIAARPAFLALRPKAESGT